MHNQFVDRLRAQRARPENAVRDDLPEVPQRAAQDHALELRDLDRALRALPAEHREVLLVGVEELSYAEVAGIVGVPIGTVMSRLSRALVRLRESLQGAAPAPGARIQRVK